MKFGILGATQALGTDGAEVALGGPRRRALLALLLLDAGRPVSTERLVDGLYGEYPPAGVGNAVQSQVSRLRQVLPVPVEGLPAGYRLAVDPDQVDAHRFRRLGAEGHEALAGGEPALAARLLREALALWRGPALADVGDAPFAAAQIVRLEELRTGAVEDRIEADLALGLHRSLVAEVGELVTAHPLRERLRGQLMRALYGSGRQSEALAAYEDARRELADSLGADPGPELAAVHLAVLRGEPLAAPWDVSRETGPGGDVPRETSSDTRLGTRSGARPGTGPHTRSHPAQHSAPGNAPGTATPDPLAPAARHQLPAQLTSFIGRADELALLADRLARQRLVTLIGPGGAGKTRLAVEAAGRHPQDACFVALAGVTEGAGIPQAVLGALGLRDGGLLPAAGSAAAPDPVARIAAALADRPLLLVLDNCEHLVADAAVLAERLLTGCPRLRILATSREALGITGEALCPVATLGLPKPGTEPAQVLASPAVRLFAERAAAVSPGFDPAADRATAETVLRLCSVLDGLPLAIELAAARLRSLSVHDIAARLGALPRDDTAYSLGVRPDALFRLLSRGSRTAQPRQRTLRGVVDWSWELLPDDERAVLRRAAVFAGGWTQAAAEAVCADGEAIDADDVQDLMSALVEKSLVVAEHTEGAGLVRYRMLESIRAYGAERLAEAGETERMHQAHAGYFLDVALTADPHLRSAEQLEWLRLLSDERDNLQAALHRSLDAGDIHGAMRLIAALSSYWLLRGVRYEGVGPARQVLAALGPAAPPGLEEEYALCVLAVVSALSDPAGYTAHVAAATEIVEGMDRIARRFPVLTLLWAPFAGVPHGDMDTLDGIEALLAGRDDPWYDALVHLGFGFQAWMVHGDAGTAQRECERSLAGFRGQGDRWGLITCLNVLADLADHRGRPDEALDFIGQALVLAEELDSALDVAELLTNRALYSLRAGDLDAAGASCERAVALSRRAGAPETLALAHRCLADTARLRRDLPAARALAEQALAECPTGWFSSNSTRSTVLTSLALVAVAEGDAQAARACLKDAVTFDAEVLQLSMHAAHIAGAAAALALLEGDPQQAAALLGAEEALRGTRPTGPDADATAAAVRAALGDTAGAACPDRGAALGMLTAYVTGG
ncbi:AfsR/SARP family transcriptional regulator [Actinacidiphila bryophytorum]|uniref:AfsR/SARP family transcriptional regulator n=1 Tax=Actinacidiphila bryophytorum TaxID=1436133 RepID=UPI0019614294|nr:BTAD domain-containing putative transcriptional regulator [Actinacidiphila bryophytorum]MBM9437342.1 winged helix-turn-helix domain-containing protein [Actinacidiphila bryophytorum]MBN6546969.1 winged helix-turn-helix domain-containing protein [Actinacidiphila bryophytorum]